jgi:hypothetical protein
MDRVVDEVPREGLDRELRTVAAEAGPLPLIAGDAGEPGRDEVGGGRELGRDVSRILVGISVLDGSRVLISVRVARAVNRQHQGEPGVIQAQDVANVTAVFQG